MAILRQGQWLAVSTTSGKFTNPMTKGHGYMFTCSVDAYVRQTATGGEATNAANNIFYKAGMILVLHAHDMDGTNDYVHVEALTGTGVASLMVIEGDG